MRVMQSKMIENCTTIAAVSVIITALTKIYSGLQAVVVHNSGVPAKGHK